MYDFFVAFMAVFFCGQATAQMFQFSTSQLAYPRQRLSANCEKASPRGRMQRITCSGSPRCNQLCARRIKIATMAQSLGGLSSWTVCDSRTLYGQMLSCSGVWI